MKAFKGFDKTLKCKGFQYKIGAEFEHTGEAVLFLYWGEAVLCERGFHSCEFPFDIFGYYSPSDSRYCEVDIDGDLKRHDSDSRIASSKIRINAEIGIGGLIQAGLKFIMDQVKWDTAKESNTGDRSAATNTGDQSAASVEGKESVAMALGYESKAKGALGCWLVLAEWAEVDAQRHIIDVRCVRVDGKKIKADIWYLLQNGKFLAVEQYNDQL